MAVQLTQLGLYSRSLTWGVIMKSRGEVGGSRKDRVGSAYRQFSPRAQHSTVIGYSTTWKGSETCSRGFSKRCIGLLLRGGGGWVAYDK